MRGTNGGVNRRAVGFRMGIYAAAGSPVKRLLHLYLISYFVEVRTVFSVLGYAELFCYQPQVLEIFE